MREKKSASEPLENADTGEEVPSPETADIAEVEGSPEENDTTETEGSPTGPDAGTEPPEEAEQPKPNIAFVGVNPDRSKKEVPAHVNLPRRRIDLPEGIEHSEGFYSEHANVLINSSRDFKEFKDKGVR